ncbi:hypothetical protein [Candidatus Cyanaurora vandensis]|uniref:hypothetical protein n=1 Tax=Candidatus Cyanaurora vandensis TaxID=2714958 RepID=UPI00257AA941|nr:hypothetical protein [Candidatus Cyanaurora vandensis]
MPHSRLWSLLVVLTLAVAEVRADELTQVTGLAVRAERGRLILEVDHLGSVIAPIRFEQVPGTKRWRTLLAQASLDAPMNTSRGELLARLFSVANGVTLEIQNATPPVALGSEGGVLRFDLGQVPKLAVAPRVSPRLAPSPKPAAAPALVARRLDLDPVSFDSSLLVSDTPPPLDTTQLTPPTVVAAPPTFIPSALERVAGRTQGLESGAVLNPGEFVDSQTLRVYNTNSTNDDTFQSITQSYTYGLTDGVEVALALQGQDNNSPGTLGPFLVDRFAPVAGSTSNTFQEFTVQGKFRLVDTPDFKSALILSATAGTRVFRFSAVDGSRPSFEQDYGLSPIPVIELPVTWAGTDVSLTFNPKLAFFPADNASFVAVNPLLGGSFGTLGAVGAGATVRLSERLQLRGDFTSILFGNNTLDAQGVPAATPVFNAGFRYLINPRLGLDLYATNSYATTGTGALVGRQGDTGLAVALTFMPSRFFILDLPENSKLDPAFDLTVDAARRKAFLKGGIGFLDGGTIPEGTSFVQLKGTSNGFLASLRTGVLDDFETGFYVNFTGSTVDESEAGTSTKIRFMNQAAGDPFTLSGVFTLGRTSNRFLNFVREDRNASNNHEDPFNAGVGDRGPLPPNLFGLVTERLGEFLILTLSAPLQQAGDTFTWWLNPKVSYVQQASRSNASAVALSGVSLGGAVRLSPALEVLGEVTPVAGENVLIGSQRGNTLPWNLAARLTLDSPLVPRAASLDLYLTNSLGLSPYQSMRVIADNGLAIGLGLNVPFTSPF